MQTQLSDSFFFFVLGFFTRHCPLIGSQAVACPLQLQPAQVPRYKPPGTRSKPAEHISQDRPVYPGGHLGKIKIQMIKHGFHNETMMRQITTLCGK